MSTKTIFSHWCSKLPVTSVSFYKDYILAGFGGYLKVFKQTQSSTDVIKTFKVFEHTNIHTLKLYTESLRNYLLCLGGKFFQCFEIVDDEGILNLKSCFMTRCNDWILDAVHLQKKSNVSYLALTLAHNSVILYNIKTAKFDEEVHCSEKCILYSARMVNISGYWEQLVVCCGTVFNQILIWSPASGVLNEQKRVEPCNYLKGHDGVIFAIHYQYETGLLFSASDDRSIRLWKFQDFDEQISSSSVVYGHEARIWSVQSYYKDDSANILLSAAEDGFCIIWKITQQKSLELIKRLQFSSNNICLAINENGQFLVGNFNGSVRLLSVHEDITSHSTSWISIKSTNEKSSSFGVIKTISLLDSNSVLAHTDTGLLTIYNIRKNIWSHLLNDKNYSLYSSLSVCKQHKLVAIGNTKGSLLVIELEDSQIKQKVELSAFDGKVQSITWNSNNLFVSGPDNKLIWFVVDSTNNLQTRQICIFKHFYKMHTCSEILFDSNLVIFGDIKGSIHLYSKELAEESLHTLRSIHGKKGVRSITQINNYIVSCGRNGSWKIFVVSNNKLNLYMTNRAAQGMDWIERFYQLGSPLDCNWYFYGFHSNKFVIWSRKTGDQIFSVMCGGGHRSWVFSFEYNKLIFLKAGDLHLVEISRSSLQDSIICSPFHSQHIQNVATLASFDDVVIIATSSDDTKIKISNIQNVADSQEVSVIRTLDDHVSNVKCLKCVSDKHFIYLLSCGSKSSIKIYQMDSQDLTGMSLRKLCGFNAKSHVRYMSIDLLQLSSGNFSRFYTKLTEHFQGFRLAVARSDGKVETLSCEKQDDEYLIKSTIMKGTIISTQISFIDISEEFNNCFLTMKVDEEHLYCGSTDGHIYIFKWSCKFLYSIKAHQSGINSLDIFGITKENVLLASGGDDNTVVVSLMSHKDGYELKSKHVISDIHSGQVTGVSINSTNDDSTLTMTSVSIDQRLYRWKIVLGSNRDDIKECRVLEGIISHVADVSSLSTYQNKLVIIAGNGLAAFKLLQTN